MLKERLLLDYAKIIKLNLSLNKTFNSLKYFLNNAPTNSSMISKCKEILDIKVVVSFKKKEQTAL
jgi:hypothetical protein